MTPSPIQPTGKIVDTATQPNSTETIFENQEQLSDGILRLSIKKKSDNQCYGLGSPISIVAIYENLTNKPLIIVDYDAVSAQVLFGTSGQLFPVITDADGEEVLTPEHTQMMDVFNTSSPLLQDLPPRSAFDVPIDFYFPFEIEEIDTQQQRISHPTPLGVYYLQFVYIGYKNSGAWEGSISSNQVEICIAD